jgi:hypothetical protein
VTAVKIVFEGDATLIEAMVHGASKDIVNAMIAPYIKDVKITEISVIKDADKNILQ